MTTKTDIVDILMRTITAFTLENMICQVEEVHSITKQKVKWVVREDVNGVNHTFLDKV